MFLYIWEHTLYLYLTFPYKIYRDHWSQQKQQMTFPLITYYKLQKPKIADDNTKANSGENCAVFTSTICIKKKINLDYMKIVSVFLLIRAWI